MIKDKKAELKVWIRMIGFSNTGLSITSWHLSCIGILIQVSVSHLMDYSGFIFLIIQYLVFY